MVVHWAADADEMNATVWRLVQEHGGRNLIKSKSMLSEECGLTPYLRERGVDAVESDLGERIMQLLELPPSHIVLPAIGVRREEVGALFEREFGTEHGNSDPTYLTHEARRQLRPKFLGADIAMTGVNFAVASTGTLAVCTNEGNADMGNVVPRPAYRHHGAGEGYPRHAGAGGLHAPLGAFGDGAARHLLHVALPQACTRQTDTRRDRGQRPLGVAGRCRAPQHAQMPALRRLHEYLPVYRRSGGYSYSYFIPGPLGINLSMLRSPKLHHGNVSACSLCYSCSDVCPAMIDLGEQIYAWRQELAPMHLADPVKKLTVKGMDFIMGGRRRFYGGIALARVAEHLPHAVLNNRFNPWSALAATCRRLPPRRSMPCGSGAR